MDTSTLKSHKFKDIMTNYPSSALDDLEEWFELRDKLLEDMKSQFITIDGQKYLPKGTMLYHGSLKYPFLSGSYDNHMTFFGLDTTISLWYILESMEGLNSIFTKKYPRFGYLYAFRLKENLPITKIIETILHISKNFLHCTGGATTTGEEDSAGDEVYKKNVCIGPQFSFRGQLFEETTPNIHHLSLELTLFYNHYKDYLELDSVYLVDPLALKIHASESEYEPQQAIVQKIDEYQEEYDQKIDKETYNRYYGQSDWYTCEYDCGYKGTYQEVFDHEKTCPDKEKKAGFKKKKPKTKKPKTKKKPKKKPDKKSSKKKPKKKK